MLPPEKRIKTKDDLKRFLNTELSQYGKLHGPYFRFREDDILALHNIYLRKCEYHKNNRHFIRGTYYRIKLGYLQNKYGMHIALNCCDEGLRIMHTGSILMNGKACLGKNCALHINSGIVAGGINSEAPTLGDGVVVGVGAIVLGGVRIADNVAIGANAVVNKSVLEENVAVAGVPAKIISNNGRLNWNKKN